MSRDNKIEKLSEIIKNYRYGAVAPLSPEHVNRWLEQFPAENQEVIISEMVHVFESRYVTEENFREFLRGLASSSKFCGEDVRNFWSGVSLLNINHRGSSQREMIQILKDEVYKLSGVSVRENVESDRYVYIDDFMFSGNSVLNCIREWIKSSAPAQARIDLVFIGWHAYGEYYVDKKLKEEIKSSGKLITLNFWSVEALRLENRLRYRDSSDVLWPTNEVLNDEVVNSYIGKLEREPAYRIPGNNSKTFSSNENRMVLEKAFLRAGIEIRNNNPGASQVLRPLGFSTFEGFGFGAMVFSFRNCPNNCPLAIWWGSRDSSTSGWYPLLERYTYDQQEIGRIFSV